MILQAGHPYVEPDDYGSTSYFNIDKNNLTEFYITSLILFVIIAFTIYLKYDKKKDWKIINYIFLSAVVYILFIGEFKILDTIGILIAYTIFSVFLEFFLRVIYVIVKSILNFIFKNFELKKIIKPSSFSLKMILQRKSKENNKRRT
jgi:uncharacterized protein YacL